MSDKKFVRFIAFLVFCHNEKKVFIALINTFDFFQKRLSLEKTDRHSNRFLITLEINREIKKTKTAPKNRSYNFQ